MGRRKKAPTDSSEVTQYAERVLDGEIIAGPHVRAAAQRHMDDLEQGPSRGLVWDAEAAKHALSFFREVLRLNGGEWEGVPYDPMDWQAFIIGSVFGWKTAEGFRRFRVAYVEGGKGCGKSPLAAGVGIYGLTADGEARAEIYAAATKKDQAMILFRDAVAMVDQSEALRGRIHKSGSTGKEWNLAYHANSSFFRPISADDGQSGPRPHIALLDEIHEHKTAHVVEMMRAGTKGRRQALIFMITNSGVDKNSICWDYHDYGIKVSCGQIKDDSFFSYICALDDQEDPFKDPTCWIKANPGLGVTIQPEYLEEQVRQAKGMPSKESIVRRLNFCQWVEAAQPWLSREVWFNAQQEYDLPDLLGRRCYGGLDLSSTQDLTAFSLQFEPSEDDPIWRELTWFWMPGDAVAEKSDKDRAPYLTWIRDEWVKALPGRAVNKMAVVEDIAEICSSVDIQSIGYDRWRIEDLKMLEEQSGVSLPPLVPYGQGFKDMAPAVDEYERRLISGELFHNGNPVQTWCAANAVIDSDPAGNRKITKRRALGRIDGIAAALMATGVSIRPVENQRSVYEDRGILFV